MKNLINILKEYMPEIEERLNDDANVQALGEIEQIIGVKLPKRFRAIYTKYNGEKNDPYTGLFLGFSFMNTEHILDTIKSFKEDDFSDMTSLSTGKVTDEKMCDRIMIPFAWDGSRGFFCLDMTPDTEGKIGQVIALDYDYNECTLLADDLDGFFEFVHKMLIKGKCYINKEEEAYFDIESGHFFNIMKDVLAEFSDKNSSDDLEVELPETFWREKFGKDKVSVSTLKKQTSLFISKGEQTISLEPVEYMEKLRELIIHDSVINDFEKICEAKELKTLILVNCTFEYEKLSLLTGLAKLKELRLKLMPLKDIMCLTDSKSLKKLSLEEIEVANLDFLKGYKSLKMLEIHKMKIKDLDFLQYLKKLTKFKMGDRAENEDGLRYINSLSNLNEFEYPVGDMSLYSGCEKLGYIGIDANDFKNPESLKDSSVESVMVYNANSEKEAKNVIKQVEEYINLSSYGYTGDFLKN